MTRTMKVIARQDNWMLRTEVTKAFLKWRCFLTRGFTLCDKKIVQTKRGEETDGIGGNEVERGRNL